MQEIGGRIYATWLIQSGRRHTFGPDLETYGPEYRAESDGSVIYYSIPLVP